jgi:hypothetical protein
LNGLSKVLVGKLFYLLYHIGKVVREEVVLPQKYKKTHEASSTSWVLGLRFALGLGLRFALGF